MTRQKICFLIGNLNLSGGTERVTTLLANALAQQANTEVHILNIYAGDQPFFDLSARVKNHALFTQKVSMKKHAIASMWNIRHYVKTHQIDTLVVVDSISCVFTVPALFGLKVKHICWEHFSFHIDLNQKFRRWGRVLASRYCDAVVTLTQHDLAQWQQHLPKYKAYLCCIYNPLPFAVQTITATQQHKTVLSVGRLRHEKGFDLLLEAWRLVQKKYPDWRLQIVGSGVEEANLSVQREQLDLSGSVELHPATADLTPYYQQTSIYALSSRSEGFGMVLLEAMAFGIPIVAFDCPVGPKEILKTTHNSVVEPENHIALAEGLMQLMQNSKHYQTCADANLKDVSVYEIGQIVTQWQRLFARKN
ncbi:glycosyltransferase family 4 protein [Acinetobacter boissieri]|uniref:Glycosyltransferase involved in cell wall bisynthesis n=1 Tax=Acinetobacter boissieri TaxID=1219383 RepID=A0A1G6JHZ6_9GAMM|nr:glycosyltransferase family 4 protein [Acinetobacter boissieri]SDC18364.1 Glycosyltransferase involved in cell wall bisynthesis [Acinetobacter boissieri]